MKRIMVVLAVVGMLLGSTVQASDDGTACVRDEVVYANPGHYPAVCNPAPGLEWICTVYAEFFVEEEDYAAAVEEWHALMDPYIACRLENYFEWLAWRIGGGGR